MGISPLFQAASSGHRACVEQLLAAGAKVDLADHDGWTPLMIAAHKGQRDAALLLIKAGADQTVKSKSKWNVHPAGSTAREIAERKGHKWGDAFWRQ